MTQKGVELNKNNTKGTFGSFITRWGSILVLVLVFFIFTFGTWDGATSNFLTTSNITNILRTISVTTVIAIGLTYALAVDGMDLSIGANATFTGAFVMTMFVWYELHPVSAIILTLLISLTVAMVNSLLIVVLKVPDMIASLSVMFIFEGVALTYARGAAITERMVMPNGQQAPGLVPAVFKAIGRQPNAIIIMIIVVVIAFFFLTYTKHGRYMYAVGGNQEAARLSGIAVNKYKVLAYVLSAVFASIGGIMLASYNGSAQPKAGDAFMMPAVAAAFIGFSVAGAGKPNAIGTLVGAALMGILENGLIMMAVPYFVMDIIKGSVLAAALALTYARKD